MASRPAGTLYDGVDLSTTGDGATFERYKQDFVVRYVSPNTTNHPHKRITLAEQQDYFDHGLAVCYVWETTATESTSGRAAGQRDAGLAADYVASLGAPADQPIYFATDQDVYGSSVDPYHRGIVDEIGVARSGSYGGIKVIRYLFDQKLISYGWQTYAWSSGMLDARSQAYQYLNDQMMGGFNVDLNAALAQHYGQWNGGSMDLTPQNLSDIAAAVWAYGILNDQLDPDALVAANKFMTSINRQVNQMPNTIRDIRIDTLAPPVSGGPVTLGQAERMTYYRVDYLANKFALDVSAKVAAILSQSQSNGSGISELKQMVSAITGGATAAGVTPDQMADILQAAAYEARSMTPAPPTT